MVTVDWAPKQVIVVALDDATNAVGSVMVTEVTDVQPFASVTVKLYVPAVLLKVPVPVKGAVPPVADTVTVDDPPLHNIAVALEAATNCVGCVTVTADDVAEQVGLATSLATTV